MSMREGNTTSTATDPGTDDRSATVSRHDQHLREDKRNDPTAYWYAEALSQR